MKKKGELLVTVLGILAVLVIVCMAVHEYFSYNCDIASCYSDNLYVVKDALETFVQNHDGDIPKSLEEFRKEWEMFDTFYMCHVAKKPFLWKPKGVQTPDGRPIIVMCPWRSHGFLRKFSWGLVQNAEEFSFVRVRSDGKVLPPR